MDVNTLVTIVGSLGFPIAACMGCMWYVKYQADNHKEEINKITESLNNNTLVIQKLVDKLDMDEARFYDVK